MIDPVAFHFFGIAIRWYGIAYFSTFVISILLCKKLCNYTKTINKADINSLANYIVFGVIFGGRIGEFLFYHPNLLFSKELFMIRNGGMSFHGGILGVIVTILIFAKINKKNKYEVGDLVTICVPIGSFFGRLANYVNCELHGRVCNITIGNVHFSEYPIAFIEAALEGVALFVILIVCAKRNLSYPGKTGALFLIFHGFFRFFAEFFRIPNGKILCFSVAQVLSIIMVMAGFAVLIWKNKKIKN